MIAPLPRNGPVEEVGVVGAGIVGLAYALSAARRGHRVTVFERSPFASGASIRNFGMVWPVGQPAGEPLAVALRSRGIWLELAEEAGLWVLPCGSIHLAHREDELAVLEEFAALAPGLGYSCELLSPGEVCSRSPAANPDGLLGGLFSPTELCIDPRAALRALPGFLARRFDVRFHFDTTIIAVEPGRALAAGGRSWAFDRIIVCGGADFETLFPELLRSSGLRRCKLQMLRTVPQPDGWRLGPHLAGGLTLRHYANFSPCPSVPELARRIAEETPELDAYGIHVMAAQNDLGEVVLGDSHEYDDAIEPFDKALIDDLILRELRRILLLPDWTIAGRWHGIYPKPPSGAMPFEAEPMPRVFVRNGVGGTGMTMSFGLAERSWESWS
ncbi:TIGR03364 family FAD-dependent oxidoreductase [Tautonia sociabilis]|uniref:TIGR03364 family FAD-dependent oxidoreductase n=1 Tax=Tautonia sociabilis TaxID=2080755 RepID=A0A432MQ40_9BACT|nr:TIGR03364 family FAD-dependent oxidoreductase [Tautonia sociabilis]RUL89185.1 TIGR03364 family FAD-dependent oxidoreductase [Tautonia sociabilis]